ncbi:MAG: HEAT repeat domain-containing protein, partial [Planctomycetota bacterium]
AATVVIRDIGYAEGEPAYLYEQLRKAAGRFYHEQTAGSRERTEANRKRAEQDAVRNSAGFGPVWYNYEIAEAEIGRSRVVAGPVRDDERVFYLFPIADLEQLETAADGVRQVSVDPASCTVTLQSVLPGVLPDGEPDKLSDLYPKEKQVRLIIKYDADFGSDADRHAWLRQQAGAPEMTPDGDRLLSTAKHRWLSSGNTLTLSVAPVDDFEAYVQRIGFGDVTDVDSRNRTVELVAKIPADVTELVRNGSGGSIRGGMANDREPAPGEAKNVWAARVLQDSDDFWARKEAIEHLQKTLPEEATEQERAVIGEALLFSMRAPERRERLSLCELLIAFRPVGYAELVAEQIIDDELWHRDRTKLLKTLAAADDPAAKSAAADAAVAVSSETWMGDEALKTLRDLGPAAEDAVLELLDDPDPKVRADVATMLGLIGTKKSADALLARSKVEQNRDLAKHMRAKRGEINRRLTAQRRSED